MRFVLAFVAAAAGFAFSGPPVFSQASDYDNVITFGDSLSDNGNLFATTGLPPFPYSNGRFSNGPVWAELLAGGSMNSPFQGTAINGDVDVNLAFGGARADGDILIPPGVPAQIGAFQFFGGSIQDDDLVTVWAGANDVFQYFASDPTPTQPEITENSLDAASDNVGNVQTLIGLGAKTIIVGNLPNLGATPQFNGTPQGQQGGLVASLTFNQTQAEGLKQLAAGAPGVNIIQMDIFSAFNAVIRDPAGFGFTNVTEQCILSACALNPALQAQFLFWDSVHPTAAGHELVALYANLLLSTADIAADVAPLGEIALWTRLDASQAAFDRALMSLDGDSRGLFAEVVGNRGDFDTSGSAPSYSYDVYGVRVGFDNRSGNVSYGLAAAYLTGDADTSNVQSEISSAQADAYGVATFGPLFLGVQGGFSYTEFDDIDRKTGFGPIEASGDTQGFQYSAAVNGGAQFKAGGISLTPSLKVGYISANLDSFDESAPVLALEYDEREISGGFWSARIRASTLAGAGISVHAEVGYEDFFSLSDDGVTAKLVNNTALAESARLAEIEGRGVFVKA